jgi:hypothetical protein
MRRSPMDGLLRGLLVVIGILAVFGGGPILIVRHYNSARYRKRDEEVLGYVQARGYKFYGGAANDLARLKKLAPEYQPDVAATHGKKGQSLQQDMRVYAIVEGYVEDLAVPFGNKIWVRNLFVIPRDAGVQHLFDYVYRYISRGEGTSRTTEYQHTMAGFSSDQRTLPWFGLVPFWMKTPAGADTGHTFDTHPGFSSIYHLVGEDEEAIRRLFRPEVLSFLENHPGLRVHGSGSRLIVFRAESEYVSAADMDSHIQITNALFSFFAGAP